jgi:ABC-type transporter Mla subunit MlaD
MKRKTFKICCAAAGICVVILGGCASSGVQRTERTIDSAQTLRDEYHNFGVQIDTTVRTLDRVATTHTDDLKPAFKSFTTELAELESQAKRVVSRSKDLNSRSSRYLRTWERQLAKVDTPALRLQAEQRRDQAAAMLEDTKDELDRIQPEYEQFIANLNEIKLVLDYDLNPAGVASITNVIVKAKNEAAPLKRDIDAIIRGLDAIIATLSGY